MNEKSPSDEELNDLSDGLKTESESEENVQEDVQSEEELIAPTEEQGSLKDGYLLIIESFIRSAQTVDQDKLSPQFLKFIDKLTAFVESTKDNYSYRYVFNVIAQHIKSITYVNVNGPDILGDKYSNDKYNTILSALVSSCNEVIDTFIVNDIAINAEQADAYAVDMPYSKLDTGLNDRIGFELNIIEKSITHYDAARKEKEDKQAETNALVMQVMMLLGGLDYKNDLSAKKILIAYWPSKVNIPKKLNLHKVQQLSSIVATDLIIKGKTIQDLITEFNLDPNLLDALKFTEEDLSALAAGDLTPELKEQLTEENGKIEEMKSGLTQEKE